MAPLLLLIHFMALALAILWHTGTLQLCGRPSGCDRFSCATYLHISSHTQQPTPNTLREFACTGMNWSTYTLCSARAQNQIKCLTNHADVFHSVRCCRASKDECVLMDDDFPVIS